MLVSICQFAGTVFPRVAAAWATLVKTAREYNGQSRWVVLFCDLVTVTRFAGVLAVFSLPDPGLAAYDRLIGAEVEIKKQNSKQIIKITTDQTRV
jgi:hypothetical protein